MAHPGGAEEAAHLAQRHFELVADRAVDQEVGGEVEHDQEVRHRLQAHDPQRRNVAISVFYTLNLHIFKHRNDCLYKYYWFFPFIFTYEGNNKDTEEDTKGVTHDVHEHNRDQSHRQVKLALTLLAPPPTQNLKL